MRKEIPVQQGEKYEITIKTLGASGEGVGRVADFTVFVPGALPGERVLVRIDEVKKTYARGKLGEKSSAHFPRLSDLRLLRWLSASAPVV